MKKNLLSNIICIIGIIIGGFAIIQGNSIVDSSSHSIFHFDRMEFRADYYNAIYNAITDLQEYSPKIVTSIYYCFGILISFIGLIDICAFGYLLTKNICFVKEEISEEASEETEEQYEITA